ncbi:MAG: hypothetical protein KatS3mg051_1505 [Anaerolineae bacterium]|nr:MAG: hypothetical protein KatS3mg051_1505 [Anaerolineae bacterium]
MPAGRWEYLTVYLSGALDFPEAVGRAEQLIWAGKSLTQQLNEHAAQGWEIIDLRWLSELEMMVTFRRPRPPAPRTRSGSGSGG